MSKYLLFGFPDYYPSGGMEDIITQFNTVEEVEKYFNVATNDDIGIEWNDEYQLVDTENNFSYRIYINNRYDSDLDDVDVLEIDNALRDKLINWIKEVV